MKKRTTRFVKKTAVKIIIFAFVMLIATTVLNSISTIVSNNMALGQLQHSNEMYILMNTYSNIKQIGNYAVVGITLLFTGKIASDSYKFYKTVKNEKEKNENEED